MNVAELQQMDLKEIDAIIEAWKQGLECLMFPTWLNVIIAWCPEILIRGKA